MDASSLIAELQRYCEDFNHIMNRFVRTRDGLHIEQRDDPRFRSFVIEIIDLLNDSFGKNQYSPLINQIFINGMSNFYDSPSQKSIEEISAILQSIITRLKRNPDVLNKQDLTSAPEKTPLVMPDKMTLKWLWEEVPGRYWVSFGAILFSVFLLGIGFSETNLYKALTKAPTPMADSNASNPKNNK